MHDTLRMWSAVWTVSAWILAAAAPARAQEPVDLLLRCRDV